MFLLLIQDQDTQVFTGGKHRRAGANHHIGFAVLHPLPLVVPFSHTQTGVENSHPLTEPGCQQSQQLRCQGDFRHQQHGTSAGIQALLDQTDVDGGLAGAGDTMQQGDSGLLALHLGFQPLKTAALAFVQHQRALNIGRLDLPAPQNRPFGQLHISLFLQCLEGGHFRAGEIADFLGSHASKRTQQLQHCLLLQGGFGPGRCIGHGLLRRGCQGHDFFGFVV